MHNENRNKIGSNYNDEYIKVMRNDLCANLDSLNITLKGYDCATFISGTTKEGLHPVLINFIETIRQILFEYKNQTDLVDSTKMKNIGKLITRKHII